MPSEDHMIAAIAAWRKALGEDRVLSDGATRDRYARTTAPAGTRPCCVLYPSSVEQVQRIVQVASHYGTVVYPISRGKNWGYGDACAPSEGAAIVDLSRMDRIIEINGELGYAIIESGVTQQQLCEGVQRDAPGFWVDCTGAGGNASIVGNVLERGFGHTPYGDHMRTTCGLEIVLAGGRVLRTGFGHYPNAKAAAVFPYGVGPAMDGLFTQSNLGIVTKLCLWLYPAPEAFQFFYIKVDGDSYLETLIDALRPLRMRGILNSAVHIGNDLRVISSFATYPWERAGGQTPLGDAVRAELRRAAGIGAWNVSGSLTGTKAQVRGAKRALRRSIGTWGKIVFLGDKKLALGNHAARLLRTVGLGKVLSRQLEALNPNYGLLKGIPTDAPLLGTQWRLRSPAPDRLDAPLDTGCGVMWMSPVLPLRGRDAQAVAALAEPLFHEHGFDFLVTFTMLNERAMVAVLNVAFDKSQPEETADAAACYDAVMDALKRAGYLPYRVGAQGMAKLVDTGDTFWETAAAIKRALDPGDIIARGRYIPPVTGVDG